MPKPKNRASFADLFADLIAFFGGKLYNEENRCTNVTKSIRRSLNYDRHQSHQDESR